jgi:transposase
MEIITGSERRRRWRLEDKLRIVAELEQPGASFVEVARRHDLSRGLLWNWRRRVREGTLRAEPAPMFLPVRVASEPVSGEPSERAGPPACRADATTADGGIEVTLTDGTAIRIGRDVSLVLLRRVMTVLRG